MSRPKLAITHSSSLLGQTLLELLAESGVAPDSLLLLDEEAQVGNRIPFATTQLVVADQMACDFENLAAVFLLAPDAELEDLLQHADCHVVSHCFQNSDARPLRSDAETLAEPGFIQLSPAELAVLLQPLMLLKECGQMVSVSATQVLSAASFGSQAVEELASQTVALLNSREASSEVFPLPLAFNMLPLPTDVAAVEQLNLALETTRSSSLQKIVVASMYGICTSVTVQFENTVALAQIQQLLEADPGIKVDLEPVSPRSHAQNDATLRIYDLNQPGNDAKLVQFWIIADSIRNRLVTNYQEIANVLIKSFL